MKIQFVSDIHLETRKCAKFKDILIPVAPYLALCGDIGYPTCELYEPFLEYCSLNFKEVFYVLGNHEFYNDKRVEKLIKYKEYISAEQFQEISEKIGVDSMEGRVRKIRIICEKYPNIRLLERDTYRIPETDYIIIGCTLWSNIKISPFLLYNFNDFNRICENNTELLQLTTYNSLNNTDIDYIKNILNELYDNKENKEYNVIVLTHHTPSYDIIDDKYKKDDKDNYNSFFANNYNSLIEEYSFIKAWICGHTHSCKKIIIGETIVTTNTYGYEHEIIEGFAPDTVIEI